MPCSLLLGLILSNFQEHKEQTFVCSNQFSLVQKSWKLLRLQHKNKSSVEVQQSSHHGQEIKEGEEEGKEAESRRGEAANVRG